LKRASIFGYTIKYNSTHQVALFPLFEKGSEKKYNNHSSSFLGIYLYCGASKARVNVCPKDYTMPSGS